MAKLSDLIEAYLKKLIVDSTAGYVEVQRNELANLFNCVPSQINYVLNTRFTSEQGFLVETRRGGGGYVRIVKVSFNEEQDLGSVLNQTIGQSISQQITDGILHRFYEEQMLSRREVMIIRNTINHAIGKAAPEIRDIFRASLLKIALLTALNNK